MLPKKVNCVLALCHSDADVERSLSANTRMLTMHNMSLSEETIIITGIRAIKDAVEECVWRCE